jgi:hypothetical protein
LRADSNEGLRSLSAGGRLVPEVQGFLIEDGGTPTSAHGDIQNWRVDGEQIDTIDELRAAIDDAQD